MNNIRFITSDSESGPPILHPHSDVEILPQRSQRWMWIQRIQRVRRCSVDPFLPVNSICPSVPYPSGKWMAVPWGPFTRHHLTDMGDNRYQGRVPTSILYSMISKKGSRAPDMGLTSLHRHPSCWIYSYRGVSGYILVVVNACVKAKGRVVATQSITTNIIELGACIPKFPRFHSVTLYGVAPVLYYLMYTEKFLFNQWLGLLFDANKWIKHSGSPSKVL